MGPTNYIPAIRHIENDDDDNFQEYEENPPANLD